MVLPRILFGSVGWPCGLHEVASHTKRRGAGQVRLIRLPWPDGLLRDFRPHVVGLRVEGGQLPAVQELVRSIRRVLPQTTVVLGGPTATSHPVELLETTGADYCFAGDAEECFVRFLEAAAEIRSRDRLPEMPGVAYRWAGRAVVNLPPEEPGKARIWPGISEAILRENRLDWTLLEGFERGPVLDSVYLTAGRGCPGRCGFCTQLHGRAVRTKTVDQILEEIREADRLIARGKLLVSRWPLYEHVHDPRMPALKRRPVRWLSIFDEDFFLDRKRAVDFFRRFAIMPQARRYRLSFQTNPVSLLDHGEPDGELFAWFDRLKPMIQLGAESFHPEMLERWNKRHTLDRLEKVLDALDGTRQDYTVFHIQADYHTTLVELRESTRLLLETARRHPAMRIASSPLMIPLYDTDIRRQLTRPQLASIRDFTDFERPHPEWLVPAIADLIDRIDEHLQHALYPTGRDRALAEVASLIR
ncbi:MAG TPA: hypothetical protein DEB39_09110 [Planctomycetaceae bacterium]|nr:hypothetical protein [Planctomycetaceae bacterium]